MHMSKLILRLAALSALLLCGCATPGHVLDAYKRGYEDGRRETPKVLSASIPMSEWSEPTKKISNAPWNYPAGTVNERIIPWKIDTTKI